MVRLVFRPYTQVRKAICTSAHLRASTRVSSGFALLRHSSPSFGSQHTDSDAILSQKLMVGRGCGPDGRPPLRFLCASWVCHPPARTHVALLGPCFKTGTLEAFSRHQRGAVPRRDRSTPHPRPARRRRGPIKGPLSPASPVDAGAPPENSLALSGPGSTGAICDLQCLPPQQFQALFNSLFKVLFIFPSRYLFAIGLPSVFSLRWDLPPDFCCIPKQQDSPKAFRAVGAAGADGVLTLSDPPFQETWAPAPTEGASLDHNSEAQAPQILKLGCSRFARRY